MDVQPKKSNDWAIWAFAFGYFACYVPYSALTKAVTKGLFPSLGAVDGFRILPGNAVANVVVMVLFLSAMGWWKYSGRRTVAGRMIPFPGRWTALSGVCTAVVIGTTTLAYTFSGISIVFMLLLMKGGVLVLAPIVDALGNRKVRWFSWIALVLSLLAVTADFVSPEAFGDLVHGHAGDAAALLFSKANFRLTTIAVVDVVFYLAAYFVRFRFMTKLAKSDDADASMRYFVEEQLVATPVFLAALAIGALIPTARPEVLALRTGFGDLLHVASPLLGLSLLIGALSQGTGIFGSLVFLDKRENTYCIPVNRVSSVFAGVLATAILAWSLGQAGLKENEAVGATVLVIAILVLSVGPMWEKRRLSRAAQQPAAPPAASAPRAG